MTLQRVAARDGRDLLVRPADGELEVLGEWDGGRILDAVPEHGTELLDAAAARPLPFLRDSAKILCVGLQGKALDSLSPMGSVVAPLTDDLTITTRVDGEVVQHGRIDELVFDAAALVAYASAIVRLRPGDVIATGTPGGVGHGMQPSRHLQPGQLLETELSGVETLRNRIR